MTLPTSGPISMGDVKSIMGDPVNDLAGMGLQLLGAPLTHPIRLSYFYGKSWIQAEAQSWSYNASARSGSITFANQTKLNFLQISLDQGMRLVPSSYPNPLPGFPLVCQVYTSVTGFGAPDETENTLNWNGGTGSYQLASGVNAPWFPNATTLWARVIF